MLSCVRIARLGRNIDAMSKADTRGPPGFPRRSMIRPFMAWPDDDDDNNDYYYHGDDDDNDGGNDDDR